MKRAQVTAAAVAAALTLAACGGDDDDTDTSTAPTSSTIAADTTPSSTTTTTAAPATPPPPTAPTLNTEGAVVIVANASRVDGAAGRMSERLGTAGFEMGEPTNSSEGPLEATKVYYNASVPEAEPVAQSVVAALGGGVALEPLPTPAPLEDPEAMGAATVLLALGNDTADQTLEELQGLAPPETTTPDTTGDTTADTAGDSSTAPTSAG